MLEVEGDIAQLFFDITNDFTLGSGGEGVATLGEDFHQVVGQVTAGEIETENGVGEGISLVDGDCVGDTIARVEHDTGGTTGGVQGQDGLCRV